MQAATLWPIPFFALCGSLIAYLLGRVNRNFAGWLATGASFLSCVWTFICFRALPHEAGMALEDKVYTWFTSGALSVDFTLRMDHLSAVMCLVVTGIGTLIHLYSVSYMATDESRPRFFSYLNLFMFSMLLLVLGGNLPVMFVGWEGVGLCSYLLIGFWHTNPAYAAAGRKAFVVNRIGDAGFLLGIFLLVQHLGTLDFVQLQELILKSPLETNLATLIALSLFVGACGKSAQIPLFVWLPDAMAGPTPVSALIHAATMVTAGVYMVARMNFLFTLSPMAGAVMLVIALATAFVAATTALAQNDIKKVLAYSTVSQLGFMFMAAAVGAYWVAIFHVVTHAFFKACLFLGAGSVIHGCHHEQDMRHMGGLRKYMPITAATYIIATLAIAGIFPFAGYQSKHAILGALEHSTNPYIHHYAGWALAIASFTAFLTAFYMTRSVALTFLGEYRGHSSHGHGHGSAHHDDHGHHDHGHPHESPFNMWFPLAVLAILSVAGGIFLQDRLPHFLSFSIPAETHAHHESIFAAIMHSWVGIAGVALALVLYTKLREIPGRVYKLIPPLSRLLSGKWYLDEVLGFILVRPLEVASKLLWKVMDQGMIDGTVNGTAALVQVSGETARLTQTGEVRHYALFMFLGTVFLVTFYFVMQ